LKLETRFRNAFKISIDESGKKGRKKRGVQDPRKKKNSSL
jgi:hypothetical protein